jgi:hypothetical protein
VCPVKGEGGSSEREVSFAAELEPGGPPGVAHVTFANKTQTPLWFPAGNPLAFKVDKDAQRIWVWFGYFPELLGVVSGDYMVPSMRLVAPGEKYKFELTLPLEERKAMRPQMVMCLQARVATKSIKKSDFRGEQQPLDEYLTHSFVARAETVLKVP